MDKDVIYVYTMEYYTTQPLKRMMPFVATQMDLEIIILSKVSQKEKDKYYMTLLICDIQINGTNEPIYKTEIESQMQKNKHDYQEDVGKG